MSEELPYATPHAWDNADLEEAHREANRSLRKRRFVGSGFLALRDAAFTNSKGGLAQDLLRNLLQQHSVEIPVDESETSHIDAVYGSTVADVDETSKAPVKVGAPASRVVEQAQKGELSLFLSILQAVVESHPAPVPTKTVIRQCCMSARPGDIPGTLDAKEIVMAALIFLSSDFDSHSSERLSLPLIECLQPVGDLEKRNWVSHGEWKLQEIKDQVLRLEQVFVASPSSWKWLKRETISPRLNSKDEVAFFFKGAIPASALAKKKGETTRKRKTPTPASTPKPQSPPPVEESVEEPIEEEEEEVVPFHPTSIVDDDDDADEVDDFPSIP